MSNLQIAKRKAQNIIANGGRAALHALAPDDFEYYACSFELLKSNGDIERIFHFPVMPNGISIDGQSIVNIMKTGTGTTVQFNDSFVPKNISINGTFGRKFRLLLSDNSGNDISFKNIKQNLKDIDLKVKTGYGAMKSMEYLLDELYLLDEYNMPRFLIFHNLAFNQSLLVEVISKNFSQSNENNMMWNYSIQLKGVADAKKLVLGKSHSRKLKDLLSVSSMQFGINKMFSDLNFQSIKNLMIK